MSKELPYFKFYPTEWITGNITLCSIEAQGLFINLCSYYWVKDCSICLTNAKQRFSNSESLFEQLISNEIITINDDDKIIINFLDEQMYEFVDIVAKRTRAGKLGGKANAKQMLSKREANANIGEERREDKRREDKSIEARTTVFISNVYYNEDYPKEMLQKFCSYWTEPNKSKTKMRFELEKVFDIPRRLTTWSNRETHSRQGNSVDPSILEKYNNYGK